MINNQGLRGPSEIHRPHLGSLGPGPRYRIIPSHMSCPPLTATNRLLFTYYFIVEMRQLSNFAIFALPP